MVDKLFFAVLGKRNSGKSTTWNELFGTTVRTGKHSRTLKLFPNKCIEVFLVSGSPEERGEYVGDLITSDDTRIVLCSVQYIDEAMSTFQFAREHGFQLYTQWLNPGYEDKQPYFDSLGFSQKLLSQGHQLSLRDGTTNPQKRVREIRDILLGWAESRNLVFDC